MNIVVQQSKEIKSTKIVQLANSIYEVGINRKYNKTTGYYNLKSMCKSKKYERNFYRELYFL